MRRRTCKLCGELTPIEQLKHKGDAVFHCRDTERCQNITQLKADSEMPKETKPEKQPKGYCVTSVVAGVPLLDNALINLEYYCQENDYELIIMSLDYNAVAEEDYVENRDIVPYLLQSERVLNDKVRLLGNLQILATAVNPLSGLEPLTRGLTTIVPTTQLALKVLPTLPELRTVYLYGTGAVSKPYYSDSKAGWKGKFHHSVSAIVVEFDANNDHYIRTLAISSSNGAITDFGNVYSDKTTTKEEGYTLVRGDIHVGYTSNTDEEAIEKLVSELGEPNQLILHDVFDGSSINHHELKNPFSRETDFPTLEAELEANLAYLRKWSGKAKKVVLVDSNHHDFIYKWIIAQDWKKLKNSVGNQKLYLVASLLVSEASENLLKDLLSYTGTIPDNISFLTKDSSYQVGGVELGIHGHGFSASSNNFSNLGFKSVTGHTHSPLINKSHWCVGTSTQLQLPYQSGLNKSSNTHCLVYDNGKRQMFTNFKGNYRGLA